MDPATSYLAEFAEPDGYLNFGRYGPPSRAVLAVGSDMLDASSRPALGTLEGLRGQDASARPAVARLTGVREEQVVLLPNTSTGLFHVALGLRGGRVAVSHDEFPANVYPWHRAASLGRIAVQPITTDAGRVTPDALRRSLTPDTVAVSVSAVDFRTGYRADLAALREVVGDRLLIVDGIQAFGAVDMPWDVADVLAVGGQKWLRAGWSTGFMTVSARALDRLDPVLGGWTAVQDQADFDGTLHPPKDGAARFSISHPSPVSACALAQALGLVESVGIDWIERRISRRVDELLDVVRAGGAQITSPADPARRAGLVAFRAPGDPRHVAESLRGCGVNATVRGGGVRLAAHASTSAESVRMVHEALGTPRGATV